MKAKICLVAQLKLLQQQRGVHCNHVKYSVLTRAGAAQLLNGRRIVYYETAYVRCGFRAEFTGESLLHDYQTREMREPIGVLDNCAGVRWHDRSPTIVCAVLGEERTEAGRREGLMVVTQQGTLVRIAPAGAALSVARATFAGGRSPSWRGAGPRALPPDERTATCYDISCQVFQKQ